MRPVNAHLQHVLYSALISGPHRLEQVARRGGVGASLLYKLCEGERHLLAEYLPAIKRGTDDIELFATLSGATDCGLVVTERKPAAESLTTDARSGALKVSAKAGKLAQLVDEIVADGVVTQAEYGLAEKSLDALERAAESVRQLLAATGPVRSIR